MIFSNISGEDFAEALTKVGTSGLQVEDVVVTKTYVVKPQKEVELVIYNPETKILDIRLMKFSDAVRNIKNRNLEDFWAFNFETVHESEDEKLGKMRNRVKRNCLHGLHNFSPGSFVRINKTEVMFIRVKA